MRWLLKVLRYPFPEPVSSPKSWWVNIAVSLFIVFLLILFQPFGLHKLPEPEKFCFIPGYGLVTFVVITIFLQLLPRIFPNWFSGEKWCVWKHGVWLLMLLMCIGLGNLLYTSIFIAGFRFSFSDLLIFETFTLLIGIFPVAASIAMSYIRYLRKNLKAATSITENLHHKALEKHNTEDTIILKGQNKNERVELSLNNFLLLKAEGNYLHIYYTKDNELHHRMIRSTLKNLLSEIQHQPSVVRCHRAYAVNTGAITKIVGNAQGLKLKLKKGMATVPVSRNYVQKIRQATASTAVTTASKVCDHSKGF